MKSLKVRVDKKEIDDAVKASSLHCMVTDSIKRDYGQRFTNIVTDKNSVSLTDRKTLERYTFPMTALGRASILQFDDGQPVKPFTMVLRHPKVRQRREALAASEAKQGRKIPKLAGSSKRGSAGQMPTKTTSRKNMGRDRFFGGRVFKDELDKLRDQLGMPRDAATA